jgi:orotidine-5'-phosphate decarboxylase
MPDVFADRLLDAIDDKGSPICIGIDPVFEQLPDAVAGPAADRDGSDATAALDAIFAFTTGVLRTVAPLVPVVKFQSAYFERYLWDGVEAYYSLIAEAKDLGLLVIGDVKRGDIGSTSTAYATAHLSDAHFADLEAAAPDAITINPMLGMDAIDPFVQMAKDQGKGLFVLVRTSNPGSADFQDVLLADGRTWSEAVADRLASVADDPGLVGRRGASSLGAVVGATQAHTMVSLRKRLPRSPFLLPGYGTQGATAEMTRAAFAGGAPALVSASRSILYAHREKRYADAADWQDAVRRATLDMRADLTTVR